MKKWCVLKTCSLIPHIFWPSVISAFKYGSFGAHVHKTILDYSQSGE